MADVEETPLPGVGIRYGFTTEGGQQLTVLHSHTGRHDLFSGDPEDPDAARLVCNLTEDDARTLAELLGASRVVREIDQVQQGIQGLVIEWLTVPRGSTAAGRTIGDLEIRSSTGVTVAAVIRGEQTMPVPGPELRLEEGDVLVVMGAGNSLERVTQLLAA